MNTEKLCQEIEELRLQCERAHATLAALGPAAVSANLEFWELHLSSLQSLRAVRYTCGNYDNSDLWSLIHPCKSIVEALEKLLVAVTPEPETADAQPCDELISRDCPDTGPPPKANVPLPGDSDYPGPQHVLE